MAHNTSSQRQNELVSELLALASNRVSIQRELDEFWSGRSQAFRDQFADKRDQVSSQLTRQHDQLETEYRRLQQTARNEFATSTRSVSNERNEKIEAAQKQAKTQHSDGEYDWFLLKQQLQKDFESDTKSAKEDYAKRKVGLKAQGQAYRGLASSVKAMLARHNCPVTIQGGDLLEDPDDRDHLGDHQQTCSRIEELVRQFRRQFWVRFREERYALIVFLVGTLASAWPLHLWLQNAAFTGIAAIVVGLVAGVISSFVAKNLAARTARQFQDTFIDAIVAGKEQLLAAQHQSKSFRDRQLNRLKQQHSESLEQANEDWQQLQLQIQSELKKRQDELVEWSTRRGDVLQQQLKGREEELSAAFQPKLDAIQQQLGSSRSLLAKAESEQLADSRAERDSRFESLAQSWISGMHKISTDIALMGEEASASRLDYAQSLSANQLPGDPLDVVQLGSIGIDLAEVPDVLSDDRRLQVDVTDLALPVALDLLHSPSLMIETSPRGKSAAANVLRLAMLRLLTSIPPGKLQFTIVDPVGLGQDFSAFMHLGDHDEQLINHRIWTESGHIGTRLTELTQHMEKVIQTYLRNEFSSIQEYNRHAGEVAEVFKVLVVANFPVGFSDEAAARLQSIVSSGPRCGVYTLLSVDPTQVMPRNFDLDELRGNTNVMVADEEDVRWAASPLNDFPIVLDALPTEDSFSQIMHTIGEQARETNRVEVPFSAVAPAESGWWQGDSRSEISVPLGRAGATKLQSIHLGHGTSQHVLISGKTGSGKSTLLHALITNLSLKYSPREVQFYLVDFKKGVEFKAYAEHRLPHARVIAIESEREFGQSVLQRLDAELRRRGDLFRRVGVQSLAGYRDARPEEHMPRILLVIDEFQEFFVKEDKIAQEASLLLDRLVRQGRAFGIHVLLGSQTLAGAYSLARATIGQMAIRIALQCSAGDAHLILSDDNDAARLLRRPGEAIYNDANGMVEGNHPFQVVWLTDPERENYLRKLAERHSSIAPVEDEFGSQTPAAPIVFEGNIAADLSRNDQLRKSWQATAPADVPLAPRAWLGEAIAIKEAPANVFHRRSGANLMLVGQREEEALGVMASSLLSLAAFSPTIAETKSQFVVLDGTRPESSEAGYWNRLRDSSGLDIEIVKSRDGADRIQRIAAEVNRRNESADDASPAIFLFIYNLSRFRELQKGEDDFGFGGFGEEHKASTAEQLAGILRDGPQGGVHTILWSDTHTNLMRWLDRQSLRDIEARILFQMSATDSSNLMDSSAAAQLGQHRAIFYSEDQGRAERFRPYGLPSDDFLLQVRQWRGSVERGEHAQS